MRRLCDYRQERSHIMDAAVLIVDDDPQVRSDLSTLFTMRGCRVQTASNEQEALQMIGAFRPSFLLLDMRMPLLDGWALVRELKMRAVDIPIVVMGPEKQAKRWAEEIKAVGFMPKPVQASRLLACVPIRDRG